MQNPAATSVLMTDRILSISTSPPLAAQHPGGLSGSDSRPRVASARRGTGADVGEDTDRGAITESADSAGVNRVKQFAYLDSWLAHPAVPVVSRRGTFKAGRHSYPLETG
jgi:hypothetical protein